MSSGSELARKVVQDVSSDDLDKWVRSSTLTNEIEESIRGHIHQELTSWMFFRKLAADCFRTNIALHGYGMLWERCAQECLIDMHWLEKYLIARGGRCKPTAIEATQVEWPDNPIEPLGPCMEAFRVQKKLIDDIMRLIALADKCEDASLSDALQTRFLRKHTRQVKNMGDLLQQTARVSKQPGVGLYHLDKELRSHKGIIPWTSTNDPDCQDKGTEEVTSLISEGLVLQGQNSQHGRK
ncbi:hypothetical protein SI65_08801 [Aspergillus cristatus]|uniref:Ferritin/DPS domain-containing protein n=1 Tax=Aspergillus cristatus TaxID=573508 RepID=A0A1E3B4R9_ASPCR|nr:hypothetical protein SI65_08801 [Aspergillus cristatus]